MTYLDKSKQIELNAAYTYAKDVERDNNSKIETWEDYFPKCLEKISEESQ